MSAAARRLIGQVLKDRGHVDEAGVQRALGEQRKHGGPIGQHLVALQLVTPAQIAAALAEQSGLESIDLAARTPSPEALACIDGSIAHTFMVLPIELTEGVLFVALGDPLNAAVLEDLAFSSGHEVRAGVADPTELARAIHDAYGAEQSLEDAIGQAAKTANGSDDPLDAGNSAPVVRLLNTIMKRAIRDRASDVHFEVYEDRFRIRYRVDGSLYEVESPPLHLAAALISRIKVMSDLDIAETKMPQDGRISLSIDGRAVDLRVATLPGIAGEGCVMRVLDRSAVNLDLEALGFVPEDLTELRELCKLPNGIVLVTGPTGSGKTTTLYSLLSEINDPAVKVITVEDPVEYDIDGIVQIPIQEDLSVTYAAVLRTVLRQDPDKILVGEIRDSETASVAVEASLTGHTVFATVHTNDAPSAITRMLDLGLEPFLLTATLEVVVAQRLVRKICPNCRTSYVPDEDLLRQLGPEAELLEGRTLFFGKGCESCFHTGYLGRTALCEIMTVVPELREAMLAGRSTGELRRIARAHGMRTLRDRGIESILAGITTVDEVQRETGASL